MHGDAPDWGADWAWGLPIIVLTVTFHAYGLGLINKVVAAFRSAWKAPLGHLASGSSLVIGGAALSAAILHGLEGIMWAITYRLLGASPDNRSAMLYSLEAITSYGHADIHLAPRWEMMGALEALNGWILFGLTTAFLFNIIQKEWLRGYK
jgi:hypothetical protein